MNKNFKESLKVWNSDERNTDSGECFYTIGRMTNSQLWDFKCVFGRMGCRDRADRVLWSGEQIEIQQKVEQLIFMQIYTLKHDFDQRLSKFFDQNTGNLFPNSSRPKNKQF